MWQRTTSLGPIKRLNLLCIAGNFHIQHLTLHAFQHLWSTGHHFQRSVDNYVSPMNLLVILEWVTTPCSSGWRVPGRGSPAPGVSPFTHLNSLVPVAAMCLVREVWPQGEPLHSPGQTCSSGWHVSGQGSPAPGWAGRPWAAGTGGTWGWWTGGAGGGRTETWHASPATLPHPVTTVIICLSLNDWWIVFLRPFFKRPFWGRRSNLSVFKHIIKQTIKS